MSRPREQLEGKRFGRLLVIEYTGTDAALYRCLCDCGSEKLVAGGSLRLGYTNSCGCLHKEIVSGYKRDLTGMRVGKLTVVEAVSKRGLWRCTCECGAEDVIATSRALIGRHKTSCGCARFLPNNGAELNKLYARYVRGAEDRGLQFSLSLELFEQIVRGRCIYCGCLGNPFIGVDRMDNEIRYVSHNSASCCGTCNFMKRDMTYGQFMDKIKQIYKYHFITPFDHEEL